jgi:hypothetical protein
MKVGAPDPSLTFNNILWVTRVMVIWERLESRPNHVFQLPGGDGGGDGGEAELHQQ